MGGASSISDDQWRHHDASAELLMRAILLGIEALWQSSGVIWTLATIVKAQGRWAFSALSAASKVRLKNAVQ